MESNKLIFNGINTGFWKLTSAVLNFKFDYVEVHANNTSTDEIFKKIEKGDQLHHNYILVSVQ